MSKPTFDRIWKNIDIPLQTVFLHLHGEPLLNPALDYFISKAEERGVIAECYSNGYHIDLGLLDQMLCHGNLRMRFSADLLSPAFYEQIRVPAKYNDMTAQLDGINRCFAEKGKTYEMNMIVGNETCRELPVVCDLMFSRYSQLSAINFSSRFPWPGLPETGDLASHMYSKGSVCRLLKTPVAFWDGNVSMCSFDYAGANVVGSLLEQKFSKIFNGKKARQFRYRHLTANLEQLPLCKKCLLNRYQSKDIRILKTAYKKVAIDKKQLLFKPFLKYFNYEY